MNDYIHGGNKILVVDDEPNNLHVMKQILRSNYQLAFAKNGARALELAREIIPNLILLDVMMPEMDGFEVCRRLKRNPELENIPVIFVTAMSDVEDESRGFDVGAVDYISKPVSPLLVRARVKTHLSLVNVNEVIDTRLEIIRRLGRAAEYKDNETGLHVIRMSHYAHQLALAAGVDENLADMILNAAPMHDVGKIGIPDRILLKPGPLDADEWRIMRQHPAIGAEIIGRHNSAMLNLAAEIAHGHHERWDGKGYPRGLSGNEIPLACRIVTICDVFDALTTRRPYKAAWPVDEAVDYLKANQGTAFDAQLVQAFVEILPVILKIRARWPEQTEAADGAHLG